MGRSFMTAWAPLQICRIYFVLTSETIPLILALTAGSLVRVTLAEKVLTQVKTCFSVFSQNLHQVKFNPTTVLLYRRSKAHFVSPGSVN